MNVIALGAESFLGVSAGMSGDLGVAGSSAETFIAGVSCEIF